MRHPWGGSGVFAGVLAYKDVMVQNDRTGESFGDELRRIGYMGDARIGGGTIAAYFEAHIEQGPSSKQKRRSSALSPLLTRPQV